MPSAVYYPHSTLRNPSLLRNALLLWDKVDCITPSWGLRPFRFGLPAFDTAADLILRQHVPTDRERTAVHKMLTELVDGGIPNWLRLDFADRSRTALYPIYPGKLADRSWELLQDESLARLSGIDSDYEVAEPLGLMMMGILAHAYGGEEKRKITDRSEAYIDLMKFATAVGGGEFLPDLKGDAKTAPTVNRLITLSLRVLDTDSIPIDRLVEMRMREARETGTDYMQLRHKYLKTLEAYVDKLVKVEEQHQLADLESDFRSEMRSHVRALKSELGLSATRGFFTRELAIGAFALAGAAIGSSALVAGTGFGAIRAGLDFYGARGTALINNPMSWLYLSRRRRRLGSPIRFKLDRDV